MNSKKEREKMSKNLAFYKMKSENLENELLIMEGKLRAKEK